MEVKVRSKRGVKEAFVMGYYLHLFPGAMHDKINELQYEANICDAGVDKLAL